MNIAPPRRRWLIAAVASLALVSSGLSGGCRREFSFDPLGSSGDASLPAPDADGEGGRADGASDDGPRGGGGGLEGGGAGLAGAEAGAGEGGAGGDGGRDAGVTVDAKDAQSDETDAAERDAGPSSTGFKGSCTSASCSLTCPQGTSTRCSANCEPSISCNATCDEGTNCSVKAGANAILICHEATCSFTAGKGARVTCLEESACQVTCSSDCQVSCVTNCKVDCGSGFQSVAPGTTAKCQ